VASLLSVFQILEWGAYLLDFIDSIAVIIASGMAIWGINAWRRELRGKKEHDLAEETLMLFYQAKDLIAAIRNPMGYGGEGTTRKASEKETEPQKQALDTAYVVFERYERHQEVFNRIYAMRYRFMALFGKDRVKPFEDLNQTISEIFFAARMLGSHLWPKSNRDFDDPEKFKKFDEDLRKYEAIFWAGGDNDKIAQRVDSLINEIESSASRF